MSEAENGEVFDATPYLKLVIDKDGRWFQNGAEIIHPEIYKQFNQMLEKLPDGGYQVRLGREVCRVEVEDAPFVIVRASMDGDGRIVLVLNDGTVEILNPEEFWIGNDNVPYCHVKNGEFRARFSRSAYYQISEHIVAGDEGDFFLEIDGVRTRINTVVHSRR
ncbi:DUF1285 domain-containing protein [Desulfomonile tiedjei]|uniref:DUF1285 domain-containing protein n=1 Tax=Desulfomonile tiedjei (strain ATCC 49306 / DSM 6799 / DCB-1) TaxID=706587 RepID=I4C9P1_DESTA|nr:DUF1285 domain-containing protein [Desulfomonile tiedjei]AFM26282.1 hypothetical protein Desti_3636 [Desulfomonile tiedjei DSM 6799]